MDKFKDLVHSKDNPETEASSGPTGRLTGPGSHFPKREEELPADTTGLQGTTTAGYVPGTDARQDTGPTSASGLTGPGSGTAAIGETSTYSSRTLPQGDTVGSVVDSSSYDRTTYQMPEHSYASSRGVPEGGPLAAAAAAFHKDRDYSTSNLPGAWPREPAYDSVTVPTSSSTSTANPADRSATYGQAGGTKTPDASAAAQSATSTASANREPVLEGPKQTSTVGKILGAVGLGTAAAGAGVAASRKNDDVPPPAVGSPDHPTTTTGVDSYTAPTQSPPTQSGSPYTAPAPRHHRKESIPTTAYPAGIDSPSPISAPVGGTTGTPVQERDNHTGRNVGLAAAGVGAGAAGAHEYEKNKEHRDGVTGLSTEPATAQTTTSSAVPSEFQQPHSKLSRDINQTPTTTAADPERDSREYGKTVTAAGVGAGAGAAGAYALEHRQPETEQPDWPLRDDPSSVPAASTVPASQRAVETQPNVVPVQQQDSSTYNAPTVGDAGVAATPYSDRQSRYEEPPQKPAAREEAALAGTGATASALPERDEEQARAEEEAERRRRREKEAALAGVAGAGAGATGLHEYNKHQHEEDEARRQKDLAEQEEARRRQFEKDEKAAKKEAKKEEKQHAKDEKAAAKEEKKQQKEAEKEERKHQKELEKEEKVHNKAAAAEYEQRDSIAREERERREKEAAAAAGLGAAGTAAYEVHGKDRHPPPTTATDESGRTKLHKDPPEEKKPSLLKRIFRRRKNKDTGEEEEYEDEEGHEHEPESEHGDHHLAAAGIGAGTGAAVAGTAATASHEPPADSYKVQSGGAEKPSYNPFTRDDPTSAAGAPGTSASAHPPISPGIADDPSQARGLVGPDTVGPTRDHPPYDPTHDPASEKKISQQGEHLDNIGGLTASHPYAEGEQKPGLAHRVLDALKPLPEREELQHHAEEVHHGGAGSHTYGTAQ